MSDPVYSYVGSYPSEDDARADLAVIQQAWGDAVVRTYDAAVVTKDAEGKIKVDRDEQHTRSTAWKGAGIGALFGIIFPPSMLASAVVGAGVGAVGSHLSSGLPKDDLKQLGDLLQSGDAALVVLASSEIDAELEKQLKATAKDVRKLEGADAEEIEKALKDA